MEEGWLLWEADWSARRGGKQTRWHWHIPDCVVNSAEQVVRSFLLLQEGLSWQEEII